MYQACFEEMKWKSLDGLPHKTQNWCNTPNLFISISIDQRITRQASPPISLSLPISNDQIFSKWLDFDRWHYTRKCYFCQDLVCVFKERGEWDEFWPKSNWSSSFSFRRNWEAGDFGISLFPLTSLAMTGCEEIDNKYRKFLNWWVMSVSMLVMVICQAIPLQWRRLKSCNKLRCWYRCWLSFISLSEVLGNLRGFARSKKTTSLWNIYQFIQVGQHSKGQDCNRSYSFSVVPRSVPRTLSWVENLVEHLNDSVWTISDGNKNECQKWILQLGSQKGTIPNVTPVHFRSQLFVGLWSLGLVAVTSIPLS
jgi:hypothetical protein